MTFECKRLSVLIIGASGETGRALMKKLYFNPRMPEVHAFCRDPSKLSGYGTYHSLIKGDARKGQDLARALKESEADVVVVSVGNGESTAKSDVRTASARALEQVLKKSQFQHVRVVLVSYQGAGNSKINIGFGIGTFVGLQLRHVLKDHTGQEQAFSGDLRKRTFIVRPTSLVNDQPATKMIEFGNVEKSPSMKIDRSDLARYIAKKICAEESSFGNIVHLSGVRR